MKTSKHAKIILTMSPSATGDVAVKVEIDGEPIALITLVTLASIQSIDFRFALEGYEHMKNHPSTEGMRKTFSEKNS